MRAPLSALLSTLLLAALPVFDAAAEAREVRWPELIPEALADVPLAPPPAAHTGFGANLAQLSPWGDLPMSDLLVGDLDGEEITISGFVVPLDLADDDRVREFLLVPYFGACVHVPPPPPNQVIHVTSTEGLALDRIYEAWSITGTLRVEATESALASAGYAIAADEVQLYQHRG